MKTTGIALVLSLLLTGQLSAQSNRTVSIQNENNMEQAAKYDSYTFPLGDNVTREKVSFKNRYGIILSGDLR